MLRCGRCRWRGGSVHPRDGEVGHEPFNTHSSSIERLCALHAYTTSRSMLHVLMVCISGIVLPILLILALDSLPLQPPNAAWDKHAALRCREFLTSLIGSIGVLLQVQVMAPAADLTDRQIVRIAVIAACSYTACWFLLAKFWVSPIPFTMVVITPI
ncbi:hypothetical protein PybrP1_007719 [[Pythium] brassicae (nom. inval.)]|nr:hypothetical protein PybrP1_007719 [[Pythium] brassicae (nom. inval.)]